MVGTGLSDCSCRNFVVAGCGNQKRREEGKTARCCTERSDQKMRPYADDVLLILRKKKEPVCDTTSQNRLDLKGFM